MPQIYGEVIGNVRQEVKSVPKVVRINAGDGEAVIYKNLGNGRRIPYTWWTTVTLASGTASIVVASGVKLNDYKVANARIVATPQGSLGGATYYINKNATTNVVTIVASGNAPANVAFDVQICLADSIAFTSSSNAQIWKRRDSNSM